MLRTPVCDVLGIDVPIIQAGMGVWTGADLVAAVSNAGALGSLGAAGRTAEALRDELTRLRPLTDRPFAVNFTLPMLTEETFAVALAARPAVISFALGQPGSLVGRAHAAGCSVVQQVHTVAQAERSAAEGADVLIAQGGEAGGFGGTIGAMALVPQVVDAVAPLPVLAAGGIGDGRGLAAALVLGAHGVNVGTRFLASSEAPIATAWKQALTGAAAEDAIKVAVWDDIFPLPNTGPYGEYYPVVPRALRTPFIDRWQGRGDEARREAERLRGEVGGAVQEDRMEEAVPFTGQSAGLLQEILPAAEIVHRLVAEAEAALRPVAALAN
jgi:nitronate monooxygenase/enoyl-[acyl-carrier protein] reductase II